MVMARTAFLPFSIGGEHEDSWLTLLTTKYPPQKIEAIRSVCTFIKHEADAIKSPFSEGLYLYSLSLAYVLMSIDVDSDTLLAALYYPLFQYGKFNAEDLENIVPTPLQKCLRSCLAMDEFDEWEGNRKNSKHIDNYRRMILAMVDDIRVVLIKLAERTIYVRHLADFPAAEQHRVSQHIMDIYAPLANRLGIFELKWELEDTAFRYLHPADYKAIAKSVNETRLEREAFVKQFKETLQAALTKAAIGADISGRAKHIYSIYKKMSRKKLSFDDLYDITAFRILVDTVDDCYRAFGIMQEKFEEYLPEFDDYIATPKNNGYQSIHMVVKANKGHFVEIQIRTHAMHEKNEKGGAAHWMYKEGAQEVRYQQKIAWLRQLLDWQKELENTEDIPQDILQGIKEDQVYVFTPQNDVIALSEGATTLDFAYQIHTSVGHRCRGAKINDRLVPLTTTLTTGDRVEILTGKEQKPSRDWLNPQMGYLHSARARAKVHAFFKERDYEQNVKDGEAIFERESKKLGVNTIPFSLFLTRFHLLSDKDFFAALGAGDVRVPQLIGTLQEYLQKEAPVETSVVKKTKSLAHSTHDILLGGVHNLLYHIAHCCKPLPGDAIIGYMSSGQGVSIHKISCKNIRYEEAVHPERLIDANWQNLQGRKYLVDFTIEADHQPSLLKDLTKMLIDRKIDILGLNSNVDLNRNQMTLSLTLEVSHKDELAMIEAVLLQIEGINQVRYQ